MAFRCGIGPVSSRDKPSRDKEVGLRGVVVMVESLGLMKCRTRTNKVDGTDLSFELEHDLVASFSTKPVVKGNDRYHYQRSIDINLTIFSPSKGSL